MQNRVDPDFHVSDLEFLLAMIMLWNNITQSGCQFFFVRIFPASLFFSQIENIDSDFFLQNMNQRAIYFVREASFRILLKICFSRRNGLPSFQESPKFYTVKAATARLFRRFKHSSEHMQNTKSTNHPNLTNPENGLRRISYSVNFDRRH